MMEFLKAILVFSTKIVYAAWHPCKASTVVYHCLHAGSLWVQVDHYMSVRMPVCKACA